MSAEAWLNTAEAKANAATDGPWETRRVDDARPGKSVLGPREPGDVAPGPVILMRPLFWSEQSERNAEFIAFTRSAFPQAVAALRAVLEVLADYPIPSKQDDPTGSALAEMEKLERLVRQAITETLGET